MENIKEIIIIGGGHSIQEGLSLDLKEKIKDKFVLTLNFAFYHFDSTVTVFLDDQFYRGFLYGCGIKRNEEHVERIKQLPLLIGARRKYMQFYSNTISVGFTFSYFHDIPVKKGFYVGDKALCGIFALHVASYLLDYKGTIYCLGYDGGVIQASNTHYYNDIEHRGIGKTDVYTHENLDRYFSKFLVEKELTIYNVSPHSRLNSFQKISYSEMFGKITKGTYNQNDLRNYIKEKLEWKR